MTENVEKLTTFAPGEGKSPLGEFMDINFPTGVKNTATHSKV